MSNIRPALETLRELDEGKLLDKLALAIHDATNAAVHMNKPAKIVMTLDVRMLTSTHLAEPAITIEAVVDTKLPKRDPYQSLFFIDADGNPTTRQTRQRDLGLSVAPTNMNEGERSHG